MRQPAKPHYLYTGAATWSPDVIVSFDTETRATAVGADEHQSLRCWSALTRIRHDACPHLPKTAATGGIDAGSLADVVEAAADITGEAWVFAHNLGFDLTVTALPFLLIERGWHLDGFHLGDESCWWALEMTGKRIVLTDSWSWVRCSLEDVGRDLGRRKRALPDNDAPIGEWQARCRKDVAILDEVMTTILDWWDANELGRFGVTGASCGWSAMRQFAPPRSILVGPEEDRTAFERRAIHAGRKEVFRVGNISGTWCADNDFVSAYCTAAAHLPLPLRPARQRAPQTPLTEAQEDARYDFIGEVEITTRRPCAPAKIDGETWWPVGTFRTVLCGPEVRFAATVADKVEVIWCRWYRMGHALSEWGSWCLDLATSSTGTVPGPIRRIAKGWGRSVVGRFAARTSQEVSNRPATSPGWSIEAGHDFTTGAEIEVVTIGGREITLRKDQDASDCSPAVTAFVEAYCRVALGTVINTLDPTKLLQCNTDGWWQSGVHQHRAGEVEQGPWPFLVSRKALERQLVILGPNHVITPHERRLSGIPRDAATDDAGRFQFQDWPSMRWQLEHGRPGTYIRPARTVTLADNYCRRWVLDTGETIPVTTAVDEQRQTHILPWSKSWGRLPGDQLATVQIETLAALSDRAQIVSWHKLVSLPRQPGRLPLSRTLHTARTI